MHPQESGEEAGKQWAEAHPAEANQVEFVVKDSFASKECHKERRPDDLICPACFWDFVTEVKAIDESVAEEMEARRYAWTKAWISGVLRA
jgi:hypothetical protein